MFFFFGGVILNSSACWEEVMSEGLCLMSQCISPLWCRSGFVKVHSTPLSSQISMCLSEWEMLVIERKTNQFHESLHARLHLGIFFSFLFSFQLPLRTALTEAQRFDLTMSKCKEVKWNDENNLIHAWATWGSAFTHRHTARAHTLELSSTSRFTLIWAEGLEPEWAGPVVSVCQSRWTLDPLSASPVKQTTCLFSPAPNFPLDVFCHVGDLAHLQYFLHCLWDINLIKTVLLVWIDFSVLVILFFFFFAFQTSVNPSWHRGEQQQDFYSCVKVEQLFVFFAPGVSLLFTNSYRLLRALKKPSSRQRPELCRSLPHGQTTTQITPLVSTKQDRCRKWFKRQNDFRILVFIQPVSHWWEKRKREGQQWVYIQGMEGH